MALLLLLALLLPCSEWCTAVDGSLLNAPTTPGLTFGDDTIGDEMMPPRGGEAVPDA